MKSFKILTATVIATSLLGSASMAADAAVTTETKDPIVKTDTKSDVKAPIAKKHMKHKKSAPVKSEEKLDTSKIDNSVKTDTTIAK